MRLLALTLLFGLELICPLVHAQAPTAPVPAPDLAAALAQATPPGSVALSVDAAKVALPADVVLPGTTPPVIDLAAEYGRIAQRFGRVIAVAPSTMTVLNTAPGEPNIYAGMPPLDAFTLLAASLNDTQWTALTSEAGLAVSDLNAQQQQMFAALLSHDGKLLLTPVYNEGEEYSDKDNRDLTDALPQAHLRMGQTVGIMLPIKGQPNSYFLDLPAPEPPGTPRRYQIDESSRQVYGNSADSVYGVPVRAELPNAPKESQLDFSSQALQVPIFLAGLKTVGDLVYRIGGFTHIELYVDKRLESHALTVIGAQSAPAADLLRALALCLTGTYRQVGPAYVLTDDTIGLGTRRQIWTEFEQQADALRDGPVGAAEADLSARHTAGSLSWFGDANAFSPEELKGFAGGPSGQLNLPLSKLTPAQQDYARQQEASWNGRIAGRSSAVQPATTEGDLILTPSLSVKLLIPGIDTPVDPGIGKVDADVLFDTPYGLNDGDIAGYQAKKQADEARHAAEIAAMQAEPSAPASAVLTLWKAVPRRAVLVHPRTAAAVDAEIAAMRKLGLNELWLDVFSGGAAHIPGSASSPAKPLPPGENDILTEALLKTRGTGISVYPTLSLLFWGQAPPAQDADLNVLGETSAQTAARWQQDFALHPEGGQTLEEVMAGGIPNWPGVAVSPAAADVRAALIPLVRALSRRSGVAGLVWRDYDTPGYDIIGRSDTDSLLLGYNEPMRLAFLRRDHADPIDIYPPGQYQGKANTDLPNFSVGGGDAWHVSDQLDKDWIEFRRDAGLEILRTLWMAANPPGASQRLPILLKQRRRGPGGETGFGHYSPPGWYGSWDDLRLPPPTLHSVGEDLQLDDPMQPVADDDMQARSQSHIVLTPISREDLRQLRYGLSQPHHEYMTAYTQSHPMAGFVLDLDDWDGNMPPGKDALTKLAASP